MTSSKNSLLDVMRIEDWVLVGKIWLEMKLVEERHRKWIMNDVIFWWRSSTNFISSQILPTKTQSSILITSNRLFFDDVIENYSYSNTIDARVSTFTHHLGGSGGFAS